MSHYVVTSVVLSASLVTCVRMHHLCHEQEGSHAGCSCKRLSIFSVVCVMFSVCNDHQVKYYACLSVLHGL